MNNVTQSDTNINPAIEKISKIDLKLILACLFVLVIYGSATCTAVEMAINREIMSLDMMEIKGASLTMGLSIFYLVLVYQKKKIPTLILSIILFGLFGYTFYVFINFDSLVSISSQYIIDQTHYGQGFYLYIASFIIFILSTVIPFKKTKTEKNKLVEQVESENMEDQYILANYIYGLEKRADLFKKLSVIIAKSEETDLKIRIDSPQNDRLSIPKQNILKIDIKQAVIPQEVMTTINESELLRLISIYGDYDSQVTHAARMAYSIRGDRITSYYKMVNTSVYDITITYKDNEIEKKLMFQTKENPNEFLEKLYPQLPNLKRDN